MGDEGAKGGEGGRGELVGCLIINSSRPVPSSEVLEDKTNFQKCQNMYDYQTRKTFRQNVDAG